MKFYIYTFFMAFSITAIFSQENEIGIEVSNDTIFVNLEYSVTHVKPFPVKEFFFVKNNSNNKLYIFNEIGYNYFNTLMGSLDKGPSCKDDIEKLIQIYTSTIKEKDFLFNELTNNYKEQEKLFDNTLKGFEFGLKNLETTVNLTHNSLVNANTTLEIATEELKEHRKKQFWKNFGNIGTGAAIGLLLGVLIAN